MSEPETISCKWCNELHTGAVNLARGGSSLRGDFKCGQCGRSCTVELTESQFQQLLQRQSDVHARPALNPAGKDKKGAGGAADGKTGAGPAAA